MYFLGHMKRFQESILEFSNMRLKPTWMLSPVRQHLRVVNPRKALAIKAEVEKLLNIGFIYPVPLIEWVSNLVHMNKNQGTIHVCMNVCDVNNACPKDNLPTPFID
jgi:hypothetical protein